MALEPLKITCTSTDCKNGLHCYLQKKRHVTGIRNGPCRDCGADLVDWRRIHSRSIADVDSTVIALKTELIRHVFWHKEIDQVAINHARRKGFLGIREAAQKILRRAIGPAQPYRDGAQTPKQNNIIYYAQHATGTCCRKCLEEWHGISLGRAMTEEELTYCVELVMRYVMERLPYLTEEGESIPNRRQQLSKTIRQKQQEVYRAKH